jgi:RNA recognition motif-containing protein
MATIVEKVTDAVNDVTAALGNTSISDKPAEDKAAKDAHNEAVLASAAEGRRLYIGNLAYATTEGELQNFFKGYLMYVLAFFTCVMSLSFIHSPNFANATVASSNDLYILPSERL